MPAQYGRPKAKNEVNLVKFDRDLCRFAFAGSLNAHYFSAR
jgi:hypothetical protein